MHIMPLEDYFDFLAPNDSRIRGHRIGIETLLDEYLDNARTPPVSSPFAAALALERFWSTFSPSSVHHSRTNTRTASSTCPCREAKPIDRPSAGMPD
jgi:hypothetical protein